MSVISAQFYRESCIRLEQLREDFNDQLRRLDRGEVTKLADDAAMETFSAEIEAEVQEEIENGVRHCKPGKRLFHFPISCPLR